MGRECLCCFRRCAKIRAAGFYAVDAGTEYEISVVTDVPEQPTDADWQRLKRKKSGTVSGKLQYAGYYTIPLSEPVEVPDGGRFAMLVELHTPGLFIPWRLSMIPKMDEAWWILRMEKGI